MGQPRLAVHRTILVVDVEGFGAQRRTNCHQLAVRAGLYRALQKAFGKANIPWMDCHREDRGDGALVLAPPEVSKAHFVHPLPHEITKGLREHNSMHPMKEQATHGATRRRD